MGRRSDKIPRTWRAPPITPAGPRPVPRPWPNLGIISTASRQPLHLHCTRRSAANEQFGQLSDGSTLLASERAILPACYPSPPPPHHCLRLHTAILLVPYRSTLLLYTAATTTTIHTHTTYYLCLRRRPRGERPPHHVHTDDKT